MGSSGLVPIEGFCGSTEYVSVLWRKSPGSPPIKMARVNSLKMHDTICCGPSTTGEDYCGFKVRVVWSSSRRTFAAWLQGPRMICGDALKMAWPTAVPMDAGKLIKLTTSKERACAVTARFGREGTATS